MPIEETSQNVTTAFENGYRLIDTAAAYRNEKGVGEAIHNSGIPREELFITTKLWNSEHGYDKALKAFDSSLKKLSLEYIDLYLIHWPLPMKNLYVETWKALEKIYKEGRVKAIGLSNFQLNHINKILQETEIVPAVLQIELHPTFNQPALRQYAKEHNIQVESWYPLGGQKSVEELLNLPLLVDMSKKYNKTTAQIVLRWHIQLSLVTIPKSSHPQRIKQNIDIFDFELTPEEVNSITALDKGIRLGADPDSADFK
jgi:diketogulonate reductase-like aldo/keto reductase